MFPFSGNPFDIEVEKATNEKNTTEDWGLILDICDKVSQSPANAKLCVKSIIKRLNHADPHVVLKAITLLDACVNNCGKTFHLEIASREFETEYKKLLNKSHQLVQQKLKDLLKVWAEGEFKTDPQLNLIPSLFHKLKLEGVDFNPPPDMVAKKSPQLSKDPNVAANQQEVDDIAKAIELSLKEKSGSPRASSNIGSGGGGSSSGATTATAAGAGAGAGPGASSTTSSSLYPSTNIGTTSSNAVVSAPTETRKVRALYDFEAAEDNELTFLAGEIIHVIDDSDQNWWKGGNQRGEGLFPANFVTADLSVEPEHLKLDQKKVQFQENVAVKTVETEPEEVEINEEKIDRLLHLLHEADPSDSQHDTQEMIHLEEQVNNMGPLIDAELERVDRKHAQLTQLSADLVEGLNLYHTLMREPDYVMLPKHMMDRYRPTNHSHMPPNHAMYNGAPLPPHPGAMPPYAYPNMPGPTSAHDIRPPPFMSMPPGAPPMSMPPQQHYSMPPPGMPPMAPPPGMGMPPPQQKIEDRGPASIPPQFTPAPGSMPNYGPPGMMQQPGAPFPSPQLTSSQTVLGPGGVVPQQNFLPPAPTASSHHLM